MGPLRLLVEVEGMAGMFSQGIADRNVKGVSNITGKAYCGRAVELPVKRTNNLPGQTSRQAWGGALVDVG